MTNSVVFKSIQHNIGVVIVGFLFAFLCSKLDPLFHFEHDSSLIYISLGIASLLVGFFIRVWATNYFYKYQMKVIVLHAQKKLITSGPYKYTRNPLYLGGNVFIFLGASLVLGTLSGVILTILHLPLLNIMISREEKQLEKKFGKEWIEYKKHVRRWI